MATLVEFGQRNDIIFRRCIVHGNPIQAGHASTGPVDVIDMNGNQRADTATVAAGGMMKCVYHEPALQIPLARIAEHARSLGTEVLTQDDFSDLNFEEIGVSSAQGGVATHDKVRSIHTLLGEVAPFAAGARWGIDVSDPGHAQFIIFQPRS